MTKKFLAVAVIVAVFAAASCLSCVSSAPLLRKSKDTPLPIESVRDSYPEPDPVPSPASAPDPEPLPAPEPVPADWVQRHPVQDDDPLSGLDDDLGVVGTIGSSPVVRSPSPSPQSPLSLVDQILQGLDLGSLAFNTPQTLQVGQVETVELLLSTRETPDQLASAVVGRPVETAEGIRVAPEMEATLTGQGFTIEAVTPTKQAVSTLQRTRWAWTVVPTKDGPQRLDLSLSARIKVEGKDTPFVVRTFTRTIEVQVDLWENVVGLIKANWSWLWTTFLVPLGAWLWKRRKSKPAV